MRPRINFVNLLNEAERKGLRGIRTNYNELVAKYKYNRMMLERIRQAISTKVESVRFNRQLEYIYLSLLFNINNKMQ